MNINLISIIIYFFHVKKLKGQQDTHEIWIIMVQLLMGYMVKIKSGISHFK